MCIRDRDRTSPTILVSGVEDKGKYQSAVKEIVVEVTDNLALEGLDIQIADRKICLLYTSRRIFQRMHTDWRILTVRLLTNMQIQERENIRIGEQRSLTMEKMR